MPEVLDVQDFEAGRVTIGVITATTQEYTEALPFYEEIIEPDLNDLAWSLGSDLMFDFIIRDAHGQAALHLEEVQYLDTKGVNLIIGG